MNFEETILPLIESRTDYYRMLHKLYRWPLSQKDYDAFQADSFRELSEQSDNELMADGFNDMYRHLRRRNTGTRQMLSADYTKVFLGTATYEGFSAQPYASLFVGGEARLMGAERMEVNRIYRQHGIKLSDGIDLPEDHLAFECEFLALMNDRAVACAKEHDYAGAVEYLQVQKEFVEQHVLNWFGRFYALANKLVDTRFYRGVLKITKSYLEEEPSMISCLIEDMTEASR